MWNLFIWTCLISYGFAGAIRCWGKLEASLDERHSKSSGESVIQPDGNGKDGADTEAMKSVMATEAGEQKRTIWLVFIFTFFFCFAGSSLIVYTWLWCKSFDSLEVNGREGSGAREELDCYTGKSTETAFSRYFPHQLWLFSHEKVSSLNIFICIFWLGRFCFHSSEREVIG